MNGKIYSKLYTYNLERKASLLERFGKPIDKLGSTVQEKLQIICDALQMVWELPVENVGLSLGRQIGRCFYQTPLRSTQD